MVRGKIVEHYQDWINYLFSPGAKEIDNPKNMESLEKFKEKVWFKARLF